MVEFTSLTAPVRPKGAHIIADLYGCDLSAFSQTQSMLDKAREILSEFVKESGMTELGNVYHFFGPGAASGVICLAESHISFHTWPEDGYVSMDIYVCNYTRNNVPGAERLFERMSSEIFRASGVKKQVVER